MPGVNVSILSFFYKLRNSIPPKPTDPDVNNYMNALNIAYDATVYNSGTPQELTGYQYWLAWDKFFKNLKGTGAINSTTNFYSHAIAIHAPLYTTAERNKWNLVNPVDSNAAFRLNIQGTWTHSATGMTPNGTNAYADTFVIPATHLNGNNTLWGCYNGTAGTINGVDMGGCNTNPPSWALMTNYGGLAYFNVNNYTVTTGNTNGIGANFVNRPGSNTTQGYLNGALVVTSTSTAQSITRSFYLGALNVNGTATFFSNKQIRFSYFFNQSFTSTQIGVLKDIMNSLLIDLNAIGNLRVAYFYGDSVTAGSAATTSAKRWTSLVSTNKSWIEVNNGVSGTTLESSVPINKIASPNLYDIRSTLPVYNALTDAAIFLSYGINDCGLGGNGVGNYTTYNPTTFGSQLGTIIDTLVGKGWPLSKIVVKTGDFVTLTGINYTAFGATNPATLTEYSAFRSAAQATSSAKGVVFIDPFNYMNSNGGASLLNVDGRHPNDTGHQVEANYILSQITSL